MISELARCALTAQDGAPVSEPNAVYGIRPFAPGGNAVTNALIDKLREGDPY